MQPACRNIRIVTGTDFSVAWRFEIDLRTGTFAMQIRDAATNEVAATAVITDLVTRTSTLTRILVSVPNSVTSQLDHRRKYIYDLKYTNAGKIDPIIKGEVLVERGVTE